MDEDGEDAVDGVEVHRPARELEVVLALRGRPRDGRNALAAHSHESIATKL